MVLCTMIEFCNGRNEQPGEAEYCHIAENLFAYYREKRLGTARNLKQNRNYF